MQFSLLFLDLRLMVYKLFKLLFSCLLGLTLVCFFDTGQALSKRTKKISAKKIVGEIEKSMVRIPAGEFVMGSRNGTQIEQPEHRVFVSEFYIGKYEITNKQYSVFARYNQGKEPFFAEDEDRNQPDHPVIGVSWYEAKDFCFWLSRQTNKKYHLPTEAQWEKAATWDPEKKLKYRFSWGNEFSLKSANIIGKEDGYEFIAPVSHFSNGASPYGVVSMSGNVQEWCADWYLEDYYRASPAKDPAGPETGDSKIIRGGCFLRPSKEAFGYTRYSMIPDNQANYFGFRVVRAP